MRETLRSAARWALAGLAATLTLWALALSPGRPAGAEAAAPNPCAANPCAPARHAANPCAHAHHAANPCAHAHPANPCAGGASREPSTLDQLIDEFLAVGEATADRPEGDAPVRFDGPAERPDWFRVLAVTRADNPLLEEGCKRRALELSVDGLARARGIEAGAPALRAAAAHIRRHQQAAARGLSYSEYLREIASCRSFCAPVVARLVECQVLAVARSPHGIVLFELDSDRVDPRYADGALANLATQLEKDSRRRVALIGRASRIGALGYNRELSARRARAVREGLFAVGVPPERITTMWFGWEPPQLAGWVADEYGMRELFERVGELGMNQSVVAVIY